MAIPVNKDQLIAAIQESYAKLQTELVAIPLALAEEKELKGHAKNEMMSISNLVSYLIGWGELVLKWNNRRAKGQPVDFPETGFKWNQLGLLAQKFYTDYEHENFSNLIKKLDKTVARILLLIESKSNHELYEVNWYEKWSLGRMIQLNTASPFKNATARIRQWKKSR